MKDRLIELLGKADEASNVQIGSFPSYEEEMKAFYTSIADYLLDNGVIVLPCKVGDTTYFVTANADGEYIIGSGNFSFSWIDYPRMVFATKAEAKAKLAELKGGGGDD